MAKKSMLKAKRCAKEAQKPTALEALLQNFALAQEEPMAPQRKKSKGTQATEVSDADQHQAKGMSLTQKTNLKRIKKK